MKIKKIEILPLAHQTFQIAKGSKILTAQAIEDELFVWCQCPNGKDAPNVERGIALYTDDQPLPDKPGRYIATVQLMRGNSARTFHAYELV